MILETIRAWWLPISTALMLAIGIGGWAIRKGLLSREEFDRFRADERAARQDHEARVAAQIADIDRRTLRIEADLQHMPTIKDFQGLKDQIAQLSGQMEGVSTSVTAQMRSLNRIEDYLFKGKP